MFGINSRAEYDHIIALNKIQSHRSRTTGQNENFRLEHLIKHIEDHDKCS